MSKKVIVHHAHHGDEFYDASTPKKEEAAWKKIFKSNDDMTCYYNLHGKDFKEEKKELEEEIQSIATLNLNDLPPSLRHEGERSIKELPEKQKELADLIAEAELYAKAKKGDLVSIKRLLYKRKDADSEGFTIKDLL